MEQYTYKWNFAASLKDKVHKAGKSPYMFDGYMLDYLAIDVDIRCVEDIDELIHILKVHRPCFTLGGNPLPINRFAGPRTNDIYTEKVFRITKG